MNRRIALAAPLTGRRRTARVLLPAAALGVALTLSACQTQSPIQTDVPYNPADGVPVHLGPVQLRDLVVISDGKDKAGVLSASMSNTSSEDLKVDFALAESDAEAVTATAKAHSEQQLSDGSQVQLASIPVPPGSVVRMYVRSGTAPVTAVVVPVVKAAGYYATLAPTPSSSTTSAP